MHDPELLTQERKAAANIIRLVFCHWCLIAHTKKNKTKTEDKMNSCNVAAIVMQLIQRGTTAIKNPVLCET